MTPAQRQNFKRLLNPRHIAFIGGRDAKTAITEARRRGYQGQMWAVNPRRKDLDGVACVASIDDLPEAPDAVYLAIPAEPAIHAVQTLAQRGAGGVVCYTAGFKEAGAAGQAAEERLRDAVGDLALIGPNCYGVINYIGNSALWSFAHGGGSPGYGAAIITQSGMLSSDMTMAQRSVPLAYMISAGNQAALGQEDFLEVMVDDPAVRAIGLHIEGLQDIPRFEAAALKALKQGVPVVALKTGTSDIGGALTISHTGSLSGSNELYQALFDRTGVIVVTNPAQLLETLKFLCVAGAPKGSCIAGFTCSGGGATMLADHAETIGLTFPPISPDADAALTNLLPEIATVSNPLDYTTPIWGQPEHTTPVFAAAMDGIAADAAILVQDYPAPVLDASKPLYRNDAKAFIQAVANVPAAICATIPENLDAETRDALIADGIAPMQGMHETLNAIAHGAKWTTARARLLAAKPRPLKAAGPICGPVMVTEAEGKAWVARAGLAVPDSRVTCGANAARTAETLGYPVALKMLGPRIAHKTEIGAVALNLASASEIIAAAEKMRRDVTDRDRTAYNDSFLVERMVAEPTAELIVGIRHDPQFGYALTLGSGGILVELIGDAVTLLLPTSQPEIQAALDNLKIGALMRGFRGRAKVDTHGIAQSLLHLCDAVLKSDPPVHDIEINPLFVGANGAIAVDVLMHMASE